MTWSNTGTFGGNTTITFNSPYIWQPPPTDADPLLVGGGDPECSSCTELSVLPVNIWDVNGYYRDLGVHPKATRKEMRLAYQAGDGQSSQRMTYCFKQLLDPEVRWNYDRMPLGSLFMDAYVAEWLNRIAKAKMSKRMADLAKMGVNVDNVDDESMQRDIYAEMGWTPAPEETPDSPAEVVDSQPAASESEEPAKFFYAFYLWRTGLRLDALDGVLGKLAVWQAALVTEFARRGVTKRFAVGIHGLPHDVIAAEIGYRTVLLLNKQAEPTEDMARLAAQYVLG